MLTALPSVYYFNLQRMGTETFLGWFNSVVLLFSQHLALNKYIENVQNM